MSTEGKRAVVSSCFAWAIWLGNWFTVNGTFRNLYLSRSYFLKKPTTPNIITRGFSDSWNILAATASVLCLFMLTDQWWLTWIAVYRCAAILVSQAAVLINTDFYIYKIEGYEKTLDKTRLLLIGLLHYGEIVVWAAVIYRHSFAEFLQGHNLVDLQEPWGALYLSAVTITTLGYGDIHPITVDGTRIVIGQLAAGMFMTLIVLGRFIGLLQSASDAGK